MEFTKGEIFLESVHQAKKTFQVNDRETRVVTVKLPVPVPCGICYHL